ncbi:MAG: ATP cone domain-containing protein [Candidatus Micrarchaeota archaeon]
MEEIQIVKESGEREAFDPRKARNALRRTGMSAKEADEALSRLRPRLREGITTKKIYSMLYEIIEEMRPEISHRFNLKRALFDIGPEGYGFEDFMGKLLALKGFRTELRQILEGGCVNHEIDVVAAKNGEAYMIECKFHNQYGTRCRIQTALYVYARFLDLQEGARLGRCRKFTKPWLITNTKFSEDVIRYGECMGMPLLGWRYPLREGLEALIDKTRCYPVTVIPAGRDIIGRLVARRIVTVFDIPESPQKLAEIGGIPLSKAREIVERAEYAR